MDSVADLLRLVATLVLWLDHMTTNGFSYEETLLTNLGKINMRVRPSPCRTQCTKPVIVNITYNVIQILAFSQAEETMSISGWFTIVWQDHRLEWESRKYGNLTALSVAAQQMWLPDIGIMNVKDSKHFDFSTIAQSRISVESDGRITWLHGAILDVTCPLDVRYFPFDYQTCYLVITPWQSSDKQMLIEPYQMGSAVDNSFLPNSNVSEWEIKAVHFKRKRYRSDLNVTYQYIRVSIHLKRQPLYFVVLVLIPFSMLSGLACLIFTLEDTGDRLSVALSLVLSMTMYVVIVSSNAPRSMRSLPVIGIYLLDQLGLLSLATVLAVINNKIRYCKRPLIRNTGDGSTGSSKKAGTGYRCPEYSVDSPILELKKMKRASAQYHQHHHHHQQQQHASCGSSGGVIVNKRHCQLPVGNNYSDNYSPPLPQQAHSGKEDLHHHRGCNYRSRLVNNGGYGLAKYFSSGLSLTSNEDCYSVMNSEYGTSHQTHKMLQRDLADRLDKIEMVTYLIISFVNGIFCLVVVPSFFQEIRFMPED